MRDHTGRAASNVEAEVDRYIVIPGQACSYLLGMIRILELREKARTALGARFTLPAGP